MNKKYVITGATFICLGIILGAFGAHALKKSLGFDEINSFDQSEKESNLVNEAKRSKERVKFIQNNLRLASMQMSLW